MAAAADGWFAFVRYTASKKRLCCRDGDRFVPEDPARRWLDGAVGLIVADSAASISSCNMKHLPNFSVQYYTREILP